MTGILLIVVGLTGMYFKVGVEPALLGASLTGIVTGLGICYVLFKGK